MYSFKLNLSLINRNIMCCIFVMSLYAMLRSRFLVQMFIISDKNG